MAREIVISADSSGFPGRPETWKALWQSPLETSGLGGRFVGTEMFPWWGVAWTRMLLGEADKLGWPVASMHGRTGGVHEGYDWTDRVVMMGLNAMLVDTPTMIDEFGLRVPRLVIHGPEARERAMWEALVNGTGPKVNEMDVENHLHVGADGTAMAVAIGLCEMGIRAGMVFDLVHDWQSFSHVRTDARKIGIVVNNLTWTMEQARQGYIDVVHLHVPLGVNNDSLRLEIRKPLLREVARVFNSPEYDGVAGTVGVENQQGVADSIYLREGRVGEQVEWNKRILGLVAQAGL